MIFLVALALVAQPTPDDPPPLADPRPRATSSNPWNSLPEVAPYQNLADSLKATAAPGQPSPLNPSCEGKTGDQCVRSAEQQPR